MSITAFTVNNNTQYFNISDGTKFWNITMPQSPNNQILDGNGFVNTTACNQSYYQQLNGSVIMLITSNWSNSQNIYSGNAYTFLCPYGDVNSDGANPALPFGPTNTTYNGQYIWGSNPSMPNFLGVVEPGQDVLGVTLFIVSCVPISTVETVCNDSSQYALKLWPLNNGNNFIITGNNPISISYDNNDIGCCNNPAGSDQSSFLIYPPTAGNPGIGPITGMAAQQQNSWGYTWNGSNCISNHWLSSGTLGGTFSQYAVSPAFSALRTWQNPNGVMPPPSTNAVIPVIVLPNQQMQSWLTNVMPPITNNPSLCCYSGGISTQIFGSSANISAAQTLCTSLGYSFNTATDMSGSCTTLMQNICSGTGAFNTLANSNITGEKYAFNEQCTWYCNQTPGVVSNNCNTIFDNACTAILNYDSSITSTFYTSVPDCGCFKPDDATNYCNYITQQFSALGVNPPPCSDFCAYPKCTTSSARSLYHPPASPCPDITECLINSTITVGPNGIISGNISSNQANTCGGGCSGGATCATGYNCVNGICNKICTSNSDCSSGLKCLNGACVNSNYCISNSDCLAGQNCIGNSCSILSGSGCSSNADCNSGLICVNGVCETSNQPANQSTSIWSKYSSYIIGGSILVVIVIVVIVILVIYSKKHK